MVLENSFEGLYTMELSVHLLPMLCDTEDEPVSSGCQAISLALSYAHNPTPSFFRYYSFSLLLLCVDMHVPHMRV